MLEICILLEHAYLNSHVARCIIWELLKSMFFFISRALRHEYQLLIRRYLALCLSAHCHALPMREMSLQIT